MKCHIKTHLFIYVLYLLVFAYYSALLKIFMNQVSQKLTPLFEAPYL